MNRNLFQNNITEFEAVKCAGLKPFAL